MSVLNKIDKAAEAKGKGVTTLWQFVKFIVVSLGAFVIQLFLPYLLKLPMSEEFLNAEYHWWIFDSTAAASAGMEATGKGLFIALTVSNILAQIFSFFVNKEKTFNSCANVKVVFPIYLIITILLVSFSAWFQPFCVNFLMARGLEDSAIAISGAICACIQFFLYFPIQMILFRKKKEDK